MLFVYFVVVLSVINIVFCYPQTEENIYDALPPIFYIDDFEKCKNEDKLFCKTNINLRPSSRNVSHHWKLIELSINDKRSYNHDELFHAICIQDFCPKYEFNDEKTLKNAISECYTNKFSNLGLSADITSLNCGNFDKKYKPGALDIIWMIIIIVYTSFVFWTTYRDYKNANGNENKCIKHFSLIRNFQKFNRVNPKSDFQKLKCIQGIRFYNMLLIIFCHTYCSYIGGYVMNTEYIENIPQNFIKLGLRNLMVFLVQTFFMFSAFLMSYHFFQIMENGGKYDSKTIWLTFVNRYLRIVPPVLVMILLGSTVWVVNLFYGPIKDLYSDLEYQRCQKNWWTSLLFINNHYNHHDMCYFTTWYLAADTQLYILSLIILSLIWRYRKNTKYILSIFVILGILVPMIISYSYNLDIIFRITPENAKNNKFRSFKFNAIYSSTYANMATFMLGLSFGYIYFKSRNYQININKKLEVLWYIFFIGLPLLIVTISSFYYSRFVSGILCGILKPLYAIGIAIGIFGMSRGIGGKIKKVCEWKPALILGNLTYSTYIVHYGVVFYRTAAAKQPLYVSDFVMMKSFIMDAVLSFFCGLLMHIFVEIPAMNIQNSYVPQVRRQRSSADVEKLK